MQMTTRLANFANHFSFTEDTPYGTFATKLRTHIYELIYMTEDIHLQDDPSSCFHLWSP